MNKITPQEEKELEIFIKDWLRGHGYSQKDLAYMLKISSSRTSEILKKLKGLHKKGGFHNIAKNLIEIEQKWLSNNSNTKNHIIERPYSQLDINYQIDLDVLMDQMEKDHKE